MSLISKIKSLRQPIQRARFDYRFGLGRIERIIASKWFNPFATFWLNFRSLPLSMAVRFPIFVYGCPNIYSLSGKIIFQCPLKTGMVKFNYSASGAPQNMSVQSEILNQGTIIFNGGGMIGTGNKLRIGFGAVLELGRGVKITDACNISCLKKIVIGDNSWIVHRSQVMDTNFHFIADFNSGEILPLKKEIFIGKHCWICNSSTIMGGGKLPDYSIVAGGSLVNCDYSGYEKATLFAGTPAKPIKSGYSRVDNPLLEKEIWNFYKINGEIPFPLGDIGFEDL